MSSDIKKQPGIMGIKESRITFIPTPYPNAVPARLLRPKQAPQKYILGVGPLIQDKGFDRLLSAFAKLEMDDVHLAILGDGAERDSLTHFIEIYSLQQRVLMPGAVADASPWYFHAKMFVVSSRHEDYDTAIIEAMTYGCPVVSFACPRGPNEIIQHRKSGLLVRNGHVLGLTTAMTELLWDVDLCDKLIAGGKQRSTHFRSGSIIQRWQE